MSSFLLSSLIFAIKCGRFFAQQNGVKSVSIATLFVKPGRIDIPFTQYLAYEMANVDMLIDYDLSWQERLHNLPYVAKLIPAD